MLKVGDKIRWNPQMAARLHSAGKDVVVNVDIKVIPATGVPVPSHPPQPWCSSCRAIELTGKSWDWEHCFELDTPTPQVMGAKFKVGDHVRWTASVAKANSYTLQHEVTAVGITQLPYGAVPSHPSYIAGGGICPGCPALEFKGNIWGWEHSFELDPAFHTKNPAPVLVTGLRPGNSTVVLSKNQNMTKPVQPLERVRFVLMKQARAGRFYVCVGFEELFFCIRAKDHPDGFAAASFSKNDPVWQRSMDMVAERKPDERWISPNRDLDIDVYDRHPDLGYPPIEPWMVPPKPPMFPEIRLREAHAKPKHPKLPCCGWCGEPLTMIYNPRKGVLPGCDTHGTEVPVIGDLAGSRRHPKP